VAVAVLAGARVGARVGVEVGLGVGVKVGLGVGVEVGASVSVGARARGAVGLGTGLGVSLACGSVGTTIIGVSIGSGDGVGDGSSVGVEFAGGAVIGTEVAAYVRKAGAEVGVACARPSMPGRRAKSATITSATIGTRVATRAQPRNRGLSPEVNHHQVRASGFEPDLPAIPATGRTANRELGW
jgi:hypothetical protein